ASPRAESNDLARSSARKPRRYVIQNRRDASSVKLSSFVILSERCASRRTPILLSEPSRESRHIRIRGPSTRILARDDRRGKAGQRKVGFLAAAFRVHAEQFCFVIVDCARGTERNPSTPAAFAQVDRRGSLGSLTAALRMNFQTLRMTDRFVSLTADAGPR